MSGKKFGGYDGPPKTIAEALYRAGEIDERRIQQINNQIDIINRLLAENNAMEGTLREIAETTIDSDIAHTMQNSAVSVLREIQTSRDKLRNQKEDSK